LRELEKLYDLTGGNLLLSPDYAGELTTNLQSPDMLGAAVLGQMEDERLLWQAAAELGVAPTEEDLAQREESFFSLWTGVPVDELAVNAEAQSFISTWYAEAVAVSGLSEDDIRAIFATEVLRTRLYTHLGANVPREELAVNSRHILCSFHPDDLNALTPPTDEQRAAADACADEALDRLAAGESFEDVAVALSDDRASAQQGGKVGWVLVSYLAPAYAGVVQDAEVDAILGPIETEFGLHIIQVLDRRMQALSDVEYENSRQGYFRLWLQTLRDEADIQRRDDWNVNLPTEPALDTLDADLLAALETLSAAE
jgi:parvulin-like peptidyl-prolyl isomerase